MKILKEFKEFATKGNVMDLAVRNYYRWCISKYSYLSCKRHYNAWNFYAYW